MVVKIDTYKGNSVGLNEFHCNAKLESNLADLAKLKLLGFREFEAYWSYFKVLHGEIELYISFYKDNSKRVNIEVIDDMYGQHYDFQSMLEKNPTFKYALKIQDLVEKELTRLQDNGVLIGHVYGEYI